MTTFPHFSVEQLTDAAEGRAGLADEAQIHLMACATCAAQLAQLKNRLWLMRTDRLVDAPASVMQRAVQLFRPQPATSRGLYQRIIAALQFDSATMEPALGVRATGSLVRQLLFSAGSYDVDIRLQPADNGWQIAGQVLGAGQSGRVTLQLAGQGVIAQTELNDLLEFSLAPIAAGKYEFVLHVEQTEVLIPEFTLPAL